VHVEKLNDNKWNILEYNILYNYLSREKLIYFISIFQISTQWPLRHLPVAPGTFGQSLSVLQRLSLNVIKEELHAIMLRNMERKRTKT